MNFKCKHSHTGISFCDPNYYRNSTEIYIILNLKIKDESSIQKYKNFTLCDKIEPFKSGPERIQLLQVERNIYVKSNL